MATPSPEQKAIIKHDPTMHGRVLAGPGTGKSLTAVWLLNRLAAERPEVRTRMLTFTRAATQELSTKFLREGVATPPPSTVHAFALSVLMRNATDAEVPSPLRIPNGSEESFVRSDIARRMRDQGYDVNVYKVRDLIREMSSRWEALNPDLILLADTSPRLRAGFVGKWREHREVFGYTLLSEISYRAIDLIRDFEPELDLPDFLLVDEYQDLNRADISFLKLLARQGTRILAIGDEDQSIYSLRMADPRGIIEFPETFGTDDTYYLTECFRCREQILAAAASVIEAAPERAARSPLVPARDDIPGRCDYVRFAGHRAEAVGVADMIEARLATVIESIEDGERIRRTVQPGEILVLIRSTAENFVNLIGPELDKRGIEWVDTNAVKKLLGRESLRDKLALLRLADHQEDSLSWWYVLEQARGVSPDFRDYIYDEACSEEERFGSALIRLQPTFPGSPTTRSKQAAAETIHYTLDRAALLREAAQVPELSTAGWGGWIIEHFGENTFSDDEIQLLRSVGQFLREPDVGEENTLGRFLGKLEPTAKDLATQQDAVRIMSMSSSKGLTVDSTFVMGVEAGLVPFEKDGVVVDLDEERRLLYVAMTRAERLCVLSFAKTRRGPTARQGRGRVARNRGRSPLLQGLAMGEWTDGPDLVGELQLEAEQSRAIDP